MEDNYQLVIAYFDKTISDEGLTRLQQWLEDDAINQTIFVETIQILEASRASLNAPTQAEQSWEKINAHINVTQHKSFILKRWKRMSVAAACLALGITGWLSYKAIKNNMQPEYATISTRDGKHTNVVLPDSSVVILSGGSTLKFVKNFDGDKRELTLNGEAFFDVIHQPQKPFVIKTAQISTVVLGTSFNIKAYQADKNVAITVLSGKVGVLAHVNGKGQLVRYLVKDQQINVDTQTGVYTFNTVNAGTVTGWTTNNLTFYNTRFKDIATSLEHHYGVKIHFTDDELGNLKLTAKFKNQALAQVIDNLCALTNLSCTQKDKQLFISPNDQKGGSIMR